MPIVDISKYKRPPFYLTNGHLETIVPSMFFKVREDLYQRKRLELADGDFLDIDWILKGNDQCMVISHGLEGSANRYYVKRTARYFSNMGWDIAAWNCRSCSGEMNRLPRFYHHGDTDDLGYVVNEVLAQGYKLVFLVGYSMGGSMSLKYLGEATRDPRVKGAAAFSVPCSLRDSSVRLRLRENRVYEQRFLNKLLAKIRLKSEIHQEVSIAGVDKIMNFDDFHDRYTAPMHGFSSKEDFFKDSTAINFYQLLTSLCSY